MYRREAVMGWVLASAFFMALGAFNPWVTEPGPLGVALNGTDGNHDGWAVLACAVLGVALFLVTRNAKLAGLWAVLAGIASAAVAISDRKDLAKTISDDRFSSLVPGWGLDLAIIASVSLAVAGLVWIQTYGWARPTPALAAPPPPHAPPPETPAE